MDYRDKLFGYVDAKLHDYKKYNLVTTIDYNDVVSTGISVLETKFPEIGPGYGGGGFVEALISNDLEGTFARADSTNRKYILFYLQLITNFSVFNFLN